MPTHCLPVSIIGAAFGAGGRSASVAEAPKALRHCGLVKRLQPLIPNLRDVGDIDPDFFLQTSREAGGVNSRESVLRYLRLLTKEVLRETEEGRVPLLLGGDHSVSIASVAATIQSLKKREGATAKMGLLWVDTHGDINLPSTSPSGNAHGMSVSALLGLGDPDLSSIGFPGPKIEKEHLAYVALRDLDPFEKDFLRKENILAFSMKEVDRYGLPEVMARALERVSKGTKGFAFSFDLDVCDPVVFPSVNTPVRGGLTYRESHMLMELIAEQDNLLEMSFCEYDPNLDQDGTAAEIACSLLESAFGKTIL